MAKARRDNRLTPDEASHALYVDFEGAKGKSPVLFGGAHRPGRSKSPWVWQAVTDSVFGPLAKKDKIEALTLSDAVERIMQRAEKHNRLIVAWSEHDLGVVEKYCPKLRTRFRARFVNARSVAKYWPMHVIQARGPLEAHS